MKFPLWLINLFLRLVEKRHLARATDLPKLRRRFVRQARLIFSNPPYSSYLADVFCGGGHPVPVVWASSGRPTREGVILYFHGGSYVFGSPRTHQAMLAKLSRLSGLRTVLPDYRLAPEHGFPAALDDAVAAYTHLIDRGYRPHQIILGGDSAGGGLALALLHVICTTDLPRPGGVFAFSPWTDLTFSGASIRDNARADPMLPVGRLAEMRDNYLQGSDPSDPRASPLFGRFEGASAVLVQCGNHEILLDDARRMVGNLKAQNIEARLDVWENVPHVWQIFQGRLSQADRALGDVAEFLARSVR
ncbi:MAG: alpha/beta hydrolase [Alphaproteobacteria bacterium]|nr:alpha/beta hydrolase [Alphaproteobacteria bacterium]